MVTHKNEERVIHMIQI